MASPVVGDRFLCVGDAVQFVDPIFSAGVYIAMASGEMAAAEICRAFRENRFQASRFARYERRLRRGVQPFLRFIWKFYEPAFVDIFLRPRQAFGMLQSVTGVLAGGAFQKMRWRMRVGLAVFFTIVRVNRWVRYRRGQTNESRIEW
jgi:2-polyprenyl-6-methoxyphenol hydroxylase-like FAD-dependent oxidoreductase